MNNTNRLLPAAFVLAVIMILPAPASAQESGLKNTFTSAVYGGLTGALVGAGVLAFTEHPGDHLDYIAIGAGVGVIAGTLFGLVQESRPLLALSSTGAAWSWPVPQARLRKAGGGPFFEVEVLAWRF